jgi:hypothetical protein
MTTSSAKTTVKKTKKHGVKAGQKSLVRPSQKKAVKNGRQQKTVVSKEKITKAIKAIPAGLDGQILADDEYASDLQLETEFGDLDNEDEIVEPEEIDLDDVSYPDKEY